MKAMAMVAHPDDCVIFAYSYIHHHPEYAWTICYLTYRATDPRGHELAQFWQRRNISIKFLGYRDDWQDIENKKISFDEQSAKDDIQQAIADQDLVLTHNEHGDYGHLHHVFVNKSTKNHPHRVTFAGTGQGTVKYVLPPNTYSLDELPLHRDVVESFHLKIHINEYTL